MNLTRGLPTVGDEAVQAPLALIGVVIKAGLLISAAMMFAAVLFFLIGVGGLVMYQIHIADHLGPYSGHSLVFHPLSLLSRIVLFVAYVSIVSTCWTESMKYRPRSQKETL